MRRKLILLPLAMPIALFVGCEGTAPNDTTTTDSALESCFATAGDGSTKCAIQGGGGFSRDPQDIDHDGRPDSFVCAHIVKVPHGWMGAGGSSGASAADPSSGARPPLPTIPTDADCERMGCQDQRPHQGGPGAGNGGGDGKAGPPSGPSSGPGAPSSGPAAADLAPSDRPASDDAGDMKCPGHPPQGPGQGAGGVGAPAGHGPGQDGAGGAGEPAGHGPGGPDGGPGSGHGEGGAGAP
jgi:hypothetical protein